MRLFVVFIFYIFKQQRMYVNCVEKTLIHYFEEKKQINHKTTRI